MIRLECDGTPGCGQWFEIEDPEDQIGRVLTCPRCGEESKLEHWPHLGYSLAEARTDDLNRYQCFCPHCRGRLLIHRPDLRGRGIFACKFCSGPFVVKTGSIANKIIYYLGTPDKETSTTGAAKIGIDHNPDDPDGCGCGHCKLRRNEIGENRKDRMPREKLLAILTRHPELCEAYGVDLDLFTGEGK